MVAMETRRFQIGFWKYWHKIFSSAIRQAWDKLGAWGTLCGILISIIVAIIDKKPKSLSDLSGNDAMVAAGIFIFLFVVVLLIFIIREPVILHNQQTTQLDKWEKSPLPNPLIISPFNDIEIKKKGENKINNPTIQRISNIKIDLIEITYLNEKYDEMPTTKEDISESNRSFK